MRHYQLILALASSSALATPSAHHRRSDGDLAPWQVTRLNTFSPSGRPGSDPYAHLWANITNPASTPAGPGVAFGASSANCTVDWVHIDEQPYGRVFECDTFDTGEGESEQKWTVEVLQANNTAPSATTNMDVRFTLAANVTVEGETFWKVLVGTRHFQLGENMVGACGASGVCSWTLNDNKVPVLVQPTVVECQGTC